MNGVTSQQGIFAGSGGRAPGIVFRVEAVYLFALSVLVFFVVGLFVGGRDPSLGTDTGVYLSFYRTLLEGIAPFMEFEPGFHGLSRLAILLGFTESGYLFLLSFLQFILLVLLAFKAGVALGYGEERYKFAILFVTLFVASPFFAAAQINTIRHGYCAIFLMFVVFCFSRREFFGVFFFALLAVLFHYSAALFLVVMPLLGWRLWKVLMLSLGLFAFYVAGWAAPLVELLSGLLGLPVYDYVSEYRADAEYRAGVRLDFAIFSLVAPLLMYCAARLLGAGQERAAFALKVCLVLVIPFWFFGWANFSDRYAYNAWMFLPAFLAVTLFPLLGFLSHGVLSLLLVAAAGVFLLDLFDGFTGVVS